MSSTIGGGILRGVRVLCALALLVVGFAHKAPALDGASIQPAEYSQYVLPDGTLQVLCLSGETSGGEHDRSRDGSGCEACRLSASALLPTPQDTSGSLIRLPIDRFVPAGDGSYRRRILLPNAAQRGPPSGLIAGTAALAAIISTCAG